MKAAVVPSRHGKWELRELPKPKPAEGQVLVKIHASGLCYTDVHQTEGTFVKFPWVLGHEPVGEIVELGPGVRTRVVGDRVGVPWTQVGCGRCAWCLRGEIQHCEKSIGTGIDLHGGHAEFLLAYADGTMLLPDGLSYEQAAPIFCAGYTVWSAIRMAEPRIGERIAVVGVGGLGHLALQYARAAGFEVVAVTRTAGKASLLESLGVREVVADGDALRKAGGADILLCTSNSYEATLDSMKGLRANGRAMIMGIDAKPLALTWRLIAAQIRVIAVQMGPRAYLHEALQYAAQGKVRVMVEEFALDDIATAYERVAGGTVEISGGGEALARSRLVYNGKMRILVPLLLASLAALPARADCDKSQCLHKKHGHCVSKCDGDEICSRGDCKHCASCHDKVGNDCVYRCKAGEHCHNPLIGKTRCLPLCGKKDYEPTKGEKCCTNTYGGTQVCGKNESCDYDGCRKFCEEGEVVCPGDYCKCPPGTSKVADYVKRGKCEKFFGIKVNTDSGSVSPTSGGNNSQLRGDFINVQRCKR